MTDTAAIGSLIAHSAQSSIILHAFNPLESIGFFIEHPGLSMIILSAVFLSVTGAEALYADMGHFGRQPIRMAWLVMAFAAVEAMRRGAAGFTHLFNGMSGASHHTGPRKCLK